MTVTGIVPLDKRRSKVFLEEDFAFVLYKGEIRRYHIEEGGELPEETYREIMTLIICKRARERAVNLLKNSDKTELELRRKLRDGFYPEEAIDGALKMLKNYRYVDDESYAARYVENQGSRKSRRQLSFDLERKGIDRDTISQLLEGNPVDEEAQIRAFLKKKHYEPGQMEQKDVAKLAAALGRKGFPFGVIRKVMAEDFDEDSF